MNDLKTYFYELIHEQRLVHGYCFTGSDLEHKQRITTEIIKALGCLTPNETGEPCGVCSHCHKAEEGQLADVIHVSPEGQSIRVGQVRELKEWLSTSPIESSFKLAVIEQAELMNPSSANALLMFLEEPVDNVYLILYTQSASNLLPTIQSRVQKIHFPKISSEDFKASLADKDISVLHTKIFMHLSQESVARILTDYNEEDVNQWFKAMNSFYSTLVHANIYAFVLVQTQLKAYLSVQQTIDGLDYLLLLNHGLIRILTHAEEEDMIQAYFLKEVIKAKQPSLSHALKLNNLFIETKQRLLANVSPQLAFERLAILASEE
ncbi:hypothetical protein ACF3NG_10560 [Aerococcaceae bacterium WGS1372]